MREKTVDSEVRRRLTSSIAEANSATMLTFSSVWVEVVAAAEAEAEAEAEGTTAGAGAAAVGTTTGAAAVVVVVVDEEEAEAALGAAALRPVEGLEAEVEELMVFYV
jgi:hypothetical protein